MYRHRLRRLAAGSPALAAPLLFVGGLLAARAELVLAHSFWPDYYSAKTTVSVDGEALAIVVVVEVPVLDLVAKLREHYSHLDLEREIREGRFAVLEDEFRDHQLAELASGLELRIQGEEPAGSWMPVSTPVNGRANEGFFVYLLEFRPAEPAVLAAAEVEVEVEVGNRLYPGEDIVFANYVEARGGWGVAQSSTPQPTPGADLSLGSPDEIAMWSEEPERRRFRVVLRRASGEVRTRE